jgi:hypothetical protein
VIAGTFFAFEFINKTNGRVSSRTPANHISGLPFDEQEDNLKMQFEMAAVDPMMDYRIVRMIESRGPGTTRIAPISYWRPLIQDDVLDAFEIDWR